MLTVTHAIDHYRRVPPSSSKWEWRVRGAVAAPPERFELGLNEPFTFTFDIQADQVGPIHVESDHLDGFALEFVLRLNGAIVSIAVVPTSDLSPPLTVRALRDLPIGEAARAAQRFANGKIKGDQVFHDPSEFTDLIGRFDIKRPGRAGRSDVEYARLALLYVDLLDHPTPAKELARREYLSPSQVRNLLVVARRRHLLTDPPVGRAGGELTDKARRLLAQAKEES